MKGLYLLIKTGYEGIEDLIIPTMDKQVAIDKILSLRKEIDDAKVVAKEMGMVMDETLEGEEWSKEYDRIFNLSIKTEENYQIYEKSNEDPDFYCIQQFNGEGFVCVCEELNVKPTKLMLR